MSFFFHLKMKKQNKKYNVFHELLRIIVLPLIIFMILNAYSFYQIHNSNDEKKVFSFGISLTFFVLGLTSFIMAFLLYNSDVRPSKRIPVERYFTISPIIPIFILFCYLISFIFFCKSVTPNYLSIILCITGSAIWYFMFNVK